MYLQEAGENAKDQAEVWKTGLESLLLFVSAEFSEAARRLLTDI